MPSIRPLALFLAAALASAQSPVPLTTADPAAAAIFHQTRATGMVLVVVRGKEVHMMGFGSVAPGSAQPPNATSLMRLCSLTKVFTTDLLIKLGLTGAVKLTDPLQFYAPAGAIVPTQLYRGSNLRPITLGDLATHTAGLPREQPGAPTGTAAFTFPGQAERWQWLPRQKLRAEPGTAALYSNVGFDLLGDALATAAHKPYAELLAERTTRPLGMADTTFSPTAVQCSRLMAGPQRPQDAYYFTCGDTQAAAGSGGLYSTPADMAKFLEYLLTAQSPAAQAIYLQPAAMASVQGLDHAGTPDGIGLGWMMLGQPGTPGQIIEKTGGGAGFSTYIAMNPAEHTGIFVALTDAHWGEVNPFFATNNLLLALSDLPSLPPPPAKPARPHVRLHGKAKARRKANQAR